MASINANVSINNSKLFKNAMKLVDNVGKNTKSDFIDASKGALKYRLQAGADFMTEMQNATKSKNSTSLLYDKKANKELLQGISSKVTSNRMQVGASKALEISKMREGSEAALKFQKTAHEAASDMYNKNIKKISPKMSEDDFKNFTYGYYSSQVSGDVSHSDIIKKMNKDKLVDTAIDRFEKLNKQEYKRLTRRDKYLTPIVQGAANMVENNSIDLESMKQIGVGIARASVPIGVTAGTGVYAYNKIAKEKGDKYYGY